MKAVLVLAAALTAAARVGAQQFAVRPFELPSAPAVRVPVAGPTAPATSPLAASLPASLPPAAPLAAAPPAVAGVPGPGVAPAHVIAVQRLADETGRAWFIHGSRQTGTRRRDGAAFTAASDLDLGVVGEPSDMAEASRERWDGVPDAVHGPDAFAPSVEEAAASGHLVVSPRRAPAAGLHGWLQRAAAPWRTASQLARLSGAPRPAGEPFRFAVIGDAEPGRFWIWRKLFNRAPGAFWRLLARADASGPDFIVQLGDMVSRGVVRNFVDFFVRLRAAAPRAPYLTVIGNHDRRSPHGVTDSAVYRSLFGGTNYAFERGGWRFVVVDSSARRITRDQLAWLDRTLAADKPTVVFTHMPPAPLGEWTDFGRKGSGGFKEGAAEFMRLMSERKVARVYMGHVHALGVLDRGGVRYVLTGGGGSPLFPGPVRTRLHHALTVDVGADGPVETVHPLDGAPYLLR